MGWCGTWSHIGPIRSHGTNGIGPAPPVENLINGLLAGCGPICGTDGTSPMGLGLVPLVILWDWSRLVPYVAAHGTSLPYTLDMYNPLNIIYTGLGPQSGTRRDLR